MKILNSEIRDTMFPIPVTAISELPQTCQLIDKSLLLIDEASANGSYNPKKMIVSCLKQKVFESVNNHFNHEYWETHIIPAESKHSEIMPFSYMIKYVKGETIDEYPSAYDIPDEPLLETTTFPKHVDYDFKVLTSYVMKKDSELESIINEKFKDIDELDCHFDSLMTITTTKKENNSLDDSNIIVTNESVNHIKNVDDEYCQMSIADGNKISNEWIVPETGNLVAYGWLDSSSELNNKALPMAYCAMEANINGSWEIIGVQPVIPAKNITYVGFNCLVKKGLRIRMRTGFSVGGKSGQYGREQDGYDTLSNNRANGFKCQVYSKFNDDSTSSNYV